MRVGILHNAYRYRGGEETVVESETDLLREAGHHVSTRVLDNRVQYATIGGKLRGAFREGTGWNGSMVAPIQQWVREEKLDVVHIHNLFPLITAAGPHAIASLHIPVVATLHNFRPLCASGTFTRAGKPCHACLGGSKAQAVFSGCYRGSRFQTMSWLLAQLHAQSRGVWQRDITRFIAPSAHVKDTFASAGFPHDRIDVRPHFTRIDPVRYRERAGAITVGRVEDAKGIPQLVREWPTDAPTLTVVGTGDRLEELTRLGKPNVQFTGQLDPSKIAHYLGRARVHISPSQLPETFGLTTIEAAACGTPTVAFDVGAHKTIIRDAVTGRVVRGGDISDLIRCAMQIASQSDPMACVLSQAAVAEYESKYTPAAGLRSLKAVYARALRSQKQVA